MTILASPWVETPTPWNMKFTIVVDGVLVYIIMNSAFHTDVCEKIFEKWSNFYHLCSA